MHKKHNGGWEVHISFYKSLPHNKLQSSYDVDMAEGYHGFMKQIISATAESYIHTKIVDMKSHKWTSHHASSGAMDNGMHGIAFSAACLVSPDINTPSSHICSHKYVLAAVLEA